MSSLQLRGAGVRIAHRVDGVMVRRYMDRYDGQKEDQILRAFFIGILMSITGAKELLPSVSGIDCF